MGDDLPPSNKPVAGPLADPSTDAKKDEAVPIPVPVPPLGRPGDHVTTATVGSIVMGPNGTLVVSAGDGKRLFNPFKRTPGSVTRRAWTDPSRPCQLPESLDDIAPAELDRAVTQLTSHRVLIVDCVDSHIQWAAASAVVRELASRPKTVRGVLSDDPLDLDRSSADADAADERRRWSTADLVHAELGGGAGLVLLELEGAAGQSLVSSIYRTQGDLETLRADLRARERHLILLPRGPATASLVRDHAKRGFFVQPLRVQFLEPWLRRRYPQDAPRYAAGIQALADRGEWNGSEEAMYDALCAIAPGAAGQKFLDRLLAGDLTEPRPLARVQQALECTDGTTEPLLIAVFVATYLPGLGQHDFSRAVETLLAGRTRMVTVAGGPPIATALVDDWRAGVRALMREADLELRTGPGGPKTIGFRDPRAATRLKSLLDATPMFVEDQLERFRDAGLLFDRSRPLHRALIDLVATATLADPDRFDADWILGLLIRIRPDLKNLPLTEETVAVHREEQGSRHLAGTHALLRRMIDLRALAASRADDPDRRDSSVVHALLERLLRLGNVAATELLLEMAHRLRDAPDFDVWHWIRQVLERGGAEGRARADHAVYRILRDEETASWAACRRVLSWLPGTNDDQGRAGEAVIGWVARWATASIRITAGVESRDAAAPTFLRRTLTQGGAEAAAALVSALLHPGVLDQLFDEDGSGGDEVAGILLPLDGAPEDVLVALDALQHVFEAWNAAIVGRADDVEDLELPRYLRPALAMAAWCELFTDDDAIVRALADQIRLDRDDVRRVSLQCWLAILVEAMDASESHLADADDDACTQWLCATDARRLRIARFLMLTNGDLPP